MTQLLTIAFSSALVLVMFIFVTGCSEEKQAQVFVPDLNIVVDKGVKAYLEDIKVEGDYNDISESDYHDLLYIIDQLYVWAPDLSEEYKIDLNCDSDIIKIFESKYPDVKNLMHTSGSGCHVSFKDLYLFLTSKRGIDLN